MLGSKTDFRTELNESQQRLIHTKTRAQQMRERMAAIKKTIATGFNRVTQTQNLIEQLNETLKTATEFNRGNSTL